MKIKKVINHGIVRWRVNDPHGTGGKRQRKFFETKEAAERFARQQSADRQSYGIHFVTIPPGRRRPLPPRAGKITAEMVAAVFDGGRQTLPRQKAVSALCARSGCAPCSAYLALSPKGRFRAQLRETEGILTWNPHFSVSERNEKSGEDMQNQITPPPPVPELAENFVCQIPSTQIQ